MTDLHRKLGHWIAKRRTLSVSGKISFKLEEDHPSWNGLVSREIYWSTYSTQEIQRLLHISIRAFRYANPLYRRPLDDINRDRVEHIIAFAQYPQYSCSTTGSSLNQLAEFLSRHDHKNKTYLGVSSIDGL